MLLRIHTFLLGLIVAFSGLVNPNKTLETLKLALNRVDSLNNKINDLHR